MIYFVISLQGVKAKYSLNLELKNITITWSVELILSALINVFPFSIKNDTYLKIVESVCCVIVITLTLLIPLL